MQNLLIRISEEEKQQLQMMSKSDLCSMNNFIRKLIQKQWKQEIDAIKKKN